MMKRWVFLILWTGVASAAAAQVTLSDCVEKARNNYPQIQELGLIREAEKYDLSTASQSWLPQLTISGKARENVETVKRSSNNVIEFLQSEGYIRFKADSEASSKAIYEAYTRWCDDNAQKPMSANRVSSELVQNERLYNVEATNNVHIGGKRVRGFVGIEVVNFPPY